MTLNVTSTAKFLLTSTTLILMAALIGTLMLTAAYLLPTKMMKENMDLSAATILHEGTYPKLFDWCTSQLDNYTDAIILMNAAYDSDESAVVQAMTAARPSIENVSTPVESLEAHYLRGVPYDSEETYYQYWHGYLLFIKPLLLFTDYNGIRVLNTAVQMFLLLFLIFQMLKCDVKSYIPAYLLSVAFLMPVVLGRSLQFSSCYYLINIGCISILLMKNKLTSNVPYLFLFIGILTAYFDFLTYPIAGLCIPSAFYFCRGERRRIKESILEGARICFSWGYGYVGMWSSKWLIGSIITKQNIFGIATSKLAERSFFSSVQENNTLHALRVALHENIKSFINTPATILFTSAVAVALIYMKYIIRNRKLGFEQILADVFPFTLLAMIPILWYALTINHCTIHHWFTCKALTASVFAVLCAFTKIFCEAKKPAEKENVK